MPPAHRRSFRPRPRQTRSSSDATRRADEMMDCLQRQEPACASFSGPNHAARQAPKLARLGSRCFTADPLTNLRAEPVNQELLAPLLALGPPDIGESLVTDQRPPLSD